MKVAYFLGSLNRGGAETLIYDICRQHENVPFDFVCVYRHDGNMSAAFKEFGAPLIHIPKKWSLLCYLLAIRRTLIQEHVTIVHSQTAANSLLLAVALLGANIKIVTTLHGHFFADAPFWQYKIVYAASELIICVSEHQKLFYEQKWKLPKINKLQVVYNGIDFVKLDVVEQKRSRVIGLEYDGKMRLCMVGNFIKGRSQLIVCRAINRLSKQGIVDFDFYFIGRKDNVEPERYNECVEYCNENQLDNVYFLGGREDVPSILKSMDGFVYSTEHDTFGIAVVEAIAAGLPIIVNDWTVMKEVCNLGLSESNRAIRFFRTDDTSHCAQIIYELLLDLRERKKQILQDCQQASEHVKSKYSIKSHINILYSIYQSL